MNNNGGIPSTCWCGKGIVTFVSKIEENSYRRFFRCEIGLKRKKENHLFKWVDEALIDEIQRMNEQQSRMAEEIENLRSSLKKTVEEEVMKHKNSGHVGCVGTVLSLLCLCSKSD
ncbi:zinc ion binding [Raphanus sativus]|nr:zinc ion binding [Raphanus sativus]